MQMVAEIKCQIVNLAIKIGQLLLWWTKGVSVMLENAKGIADAKKLRAIILLEVDFNTAHKIIFSNRLIPNLEVINTIPREVIGGRRSQDATHLALQKKLISDIANV